MPCLDPERLLAACEHGARRHPIDRALVLLSLASPSTPAASLADLPLGERNAALFGLRERLFGSGIEVFVDCASCGERMTLYLDRSHFPAPPDHDVQPLQIDGHGFRRPTSRDLASTRTAPDVAGAARALLRACADQPDRLPVEDDALDALLDRVETELDRLDPWADLSLIASCPACGAEQETALDVGEVLWVELERMGNALLDDVHLLASSYGWRESEILALSESRRAAYVERVRP